LRRREEHAELEQLRAKLAEDEARADAKLAKVAQMREPLERPLFTPPPARPASGAAS
jgi:hypothetical protein